MALSTAGMKRACENAISDISDPNLRVSSHSINAIKQAYESLLNLLSLEIVKICDEKKRSTVTSAIIIESIKKLGYDEYIDKLEQFVKDKQNETEKKNEQKKRRNTVVDQQLIDAQEKLFEEAKQKLYGNVLVQHDEV